MSDQTSLPDENSAPTGNVLIRAKFAGRCRVCLKVIMAGDQVMYNKALTGSKIWHPDCTSTTGLVPKASSTELLTQLRATLREKEAAGAQANPKELLATLEKVDEAIAAGKQAVGIAKDAAAIARTASSDVHLLRAAVDTATAHYKKLLEAEGRRITIEDKSSGEVRDLGLQHRTFPLLLQAAAAKDASGHRLNIWLTGPAGSGKTTAARNVARALDLPFYFTGSIDTEYKLLGFMNAQGQLVSRPFRQAWEHGGVFLKDEIDGSHPSAVLALNAALANGICDFPDGAIPRHPDFLCIAAANTWGSGATVDYVGRLRLDAATLDRFVQIHWPIDEDLEMSTAPDTTWCTTVQHFRKKLANAGVTGHMITPRATYYGAALLAAGMSVDLVKQLTLKKGLGDDQWNRIVGAQA